MIEDNIDKIKEYIENMGAKVIVDNIEHRLIVNNKYSFHYLNGNFFSVNGLIGSGLISFLSLLENDNQKQSKL